MLKAGGVIGEFASDVGETASRPSGSTVTSESNGDT
jgi:hypothetical protein